MTGKASMTFNDDDCYTLFLILDSYARILRGEDALVNAMRERLLPVYREWHAAHPFEVHPVSKRAKSLKCESER